MSPLNVTKPAPASVIDAERRGFARFAKEASEPVYRQVLSDLHDTWNDVNNRYFRGQLKQPHFTLGNTPPRSLGFCKLLTDWGGQLQITVNHRVVYGGNKSVVNPWPAQGNTLFVRDIVLHESIHQCQFEITGKTESSYRGHGPHFAQVCNEIGASLGLPDVVPRRRGKKHANAPVCAYWPHNVRPDGYYEPDIRLNGVSGNWLRAKPRHEPDWAVVFETFLAMIEEGRVDELKELLCRELAALRRGGCYPELSDPNTDSVPSLRPYAACKDNTSQSITRPSIACRARSRGSLATPTPNRS